MPETRCLFLIVLILIVTTVHAQPADPRGITEIKADTNALAMTPNNYALANAENSEGVRLFKASQYDEAESHYRKATELKPDLFAAYYNLGVLYLETERYQDAARCFEKAESLNGATSLLHQNLGLAYEKLKWPELAAKQFEKTIKIEPSAMTYDHLGFVYTDLQRFTDAEEAFHEALRLDPKYADAIGGLCVLYVAEEEPQQAIPFCEQMVSNTKSALAQYLLGTAYLDANRFNEAVASLQEALRLETNNSRVLLALGEARYKSGNYEAALKLFMQVAASDPNLGAAYLGSGVTYFKLRKYSEAQQSFNKAIVLNPQSSTAHFNLAVTCLQSKLRDCALEQYDILKSLSPDMSEKLFGNLFGSRVVNARNITAKQNQ